MNWMIPLARSPDDFPFRSPASGSSNRASRSTSALSAPSRIWIFLAQRRELVDVEEAAVVDLTRAALPESEAIVLRVQQSTQTTTSFLTLHHHRRMRNRRRIELHELQFFG